MKEQKHIEWGNFDLSCILRYLWKNALKILLGGLIFAMGVYLLQALGMSASYSSAVTLAVTSRNAVGSSIGSVAVTDTVALQFAELIDSNLLRSEAAERMGRSGFPASLSVSVPEGTNIVKLTVTAGDSETAYRSAMTILDCYQDYTGFIKDGSVMDIISGPTVPTEPTDLDSRDRMQQLSFPLGLVAMTGILFLLMLRQDTVQTVEGARRQVDAKLLATVYHERKNRTLRQALARRRKALRITDPTTSFYYTETIHQLRAQLESAQEREGSRIFVVTSCAENEGKSTIAANLALSLAQKHEQVLLLDADLRKPAQHLIFEEKPVRGRDFSALLTQSLPLTELKQCLHYAEKDNLWRLYALPLPGNRAGALSIDSYRTLFDALRREFRYVVVDTPPLDFFADAEAIADAADASVLVVHQDLVPAMDVNDAIDALSGGDSSFLGFVFNDVRLWRPFAMLSGEHAYGYGYGRGYGYGYGYGYGKEKRGKEEK